MSHKAQCRQQLEYTFATTRKLADLAAKLDAQVLRADSAYGKDTNILDTLQHLMIVSNAWHTALVTGRQAVTLNRDDLASLDGVRTRIETEVDAWLALVDELPEPQFGVVRSLVNYRGDTVKIQPWQAMQQVVLHAMQHHSEIARLLTEAGHSPGNIDFLYHVLAAK
jgi:uncharacterized damage-inducible protein DinB